jgi:hypothetical protein
VNDQGLGPAKAHNGHTKDGEGPTVHVAPSGTLYLELADIVPYFLPTKQEVEDYLEAASANIERQKKVPPAAD